MKFVLNHDVRLSTERSTGYSCEDMMKKPIDSFTFGGKNNNDKSSSRQVKSRGSVYIQQGRLTTVDRFKNIIAKF